jgi:hypothetical protein
MWLNRVIDARLFPYKHLLRDSLHLVDQLRNERLPVGWAMIRIDLDHFFMSGTCIQLADAVASCFDGRIKELVHRVCMFLLTHQYIASSLFFLDCGELLLEVAWGFVTVVPFVTLRSLPCVKYLGVSSLLLGPSTKLKSIGGFVTTF